MKNFFRISAAALALAALAWIPCALGGAGPSDQGIDAQEFRAPVVTLAPFWFWNGDMQPEEMERQLRAMKEAGIHQVVFHPRSGLGGEFNHGEMEYYLSETYFDRFKIALEICRKLSLKVILYDEYNWPSGQGGGRVLKGGIVGTRQVPPNPDYMAKLLTMVEVPVGPEGQRENSWKVPDGKLVGVIAAQADKDGLIRSTIKDLTAEVKDGNLKWQMPEGDWRLMFFMQRDAPPNGQYGTSSDISACCPDLMNATAMDKFIDVTHAEYYRRFPEYFGSTIIAIFTDEPGFLNNRIDGIFPNTVPWTEELPGFFEKKEGYPIIDALPLVWMGNSEENAKARYDFWDALSTLFMDNYYKKIYDWCQAHHIEAIGHVLEDTLRFHRTFEGGDYFKTMRYMNRAGVDQIADRHFGLINPKLASSAARLFGYPHSLSETFGAYGWGLTLQQMKAIIDYHAANGIDTEVLHAFFYSVEGERGHDSPPDLFYHQLWKDQFHFFVDDASRTLYLSERGRQVTDIAIFYPTTAIMTEGGLMNFVPLAKMDEYFLSSGFALRGGQYDFNEVDELALAGDPDLKVAVSVSKDGLNVNGHTYAVMVLPAVPSISSAAAKVLEKFYESGGKIIALGILPARAADGQLAPVQDFLRSVFGTDESSPLQRIDRTNNSGGRAIFIPIPNMVTDEDLAKLPKMALATAPTSIARGDNLDFTQPWVQEFLASVGQCARRDVQLTTMHPSISFLHKQAGTKDWYLVTNDSAESVTDDFTFASRGDPSLWDPETGTVRDAPVFRSESNRTTIPLTLEPYSAVAVVFESAAPTEGKPHLTSSEGEVLESKPLGKSLRVQVLAESAEPIALTATYRGRSVSRSLDRSEGLTPVTVEGPWQFRLEGGDKPAAERPLGNWTDEFPIFSGTGWYEKEIDVPKEWLAPGRKVFLDLGVVKEIANVKVNGKSEGVRLWSPFRVEITQFLKPGSNRLEIGVTNTLANRFGQGRPGLPEKPPSGLIGPVRLIPAKVMETQLTW